MLYQEENGAVPLLKWLDGVPAKARAKCQVRLERLRELGLCEMPKKKTTTDAVDILHRRYFEGQPARLAELEEARASAEVARQIYQLRTQAGLTQRELAKLVGTSHSVISRLEDDDYRGHSLVMLRRLAAAVGKRIEIRFLPLAGAKTA